MARVTSKLQVTIPKKIAQQFAIRPGDEIDWVPAGDTVRVAKRAPPKGKGSPSSADTRLRQFDEATKRQTLRNATGGPVASKSGRGWTREDLYRRGSAR